MDLDENEERIIKEAQDSVDNWYWNKWLYLVLIIIYCFYVYNASFRLEYGDEGFNPYVKHTLPLVLFFLISLRRNWPKPIKSTLIIKFYESQNNQKT